MPNGEDLLQGDPYSIQWGQGEYQGRGGGPEIAKLYAWRKFSDLFGRNPSQAELAQIIPHYLGADPNHTNNADGDAFIGMLYSQQQNTPDKLYKKQRDEWMAGAPDQYGDVQGIFQSTYGREADQNELDHYGMLLSSGQADPYQLREFLMTRPEYTNAEDKKFRGQLAGELEGYDASFFGRAKEDVISRYAKMGRPTSPALDVALTDLQAQIAERRGQYMASLSASQYGNNKELATAGYKRTQDDAIGRQNAGYEADYLNFQNNWARTNEVQDYTRQQKDYERMMDAYGHPKPGPLDYINTAFNGINAGANIYSAGMA